MVYVMEYHYRGAEERSMRLLSKHFEPYGYTLFKLIRFGMSGLAGAFVNILTTAFLHEIFFISTRFAYAVGLAVATVLNFHLCRTKVFQSGGNAWLQLIIFVFSSLLFRSMEFAAFMIQEMTINLPYLLAIIIIQGITFFIKFIYYRRLVFERLDNGLSK